MQARAAICWPLAATTGHITVTSSLVHGLSDDGRLGCDWIDAGKYRNGAARAWCRSHQRYWGTKADLARGVRACAAAAEPVAYVLNPPVLDLHEAAAPPASAALAVRYDSATRLFANTDIVQVNLTPPAVMALTSALQSGKRVGCVDCRRCGHPHLDLGAFAERAHQRHTCGQCGHDATHSPSAIVSNPLFPLLQLYGARMQAALSTVQRFLVL